ncbi:S8 family serine peptidase [Plantactinospora sp. BC1]|uniref:S8 family serine peptidase n=1 Tax=Plantactinospora sp. BC1 TaxID=2108470 RepID=UPI00131F1A9F|nr:S8 family serine peptidase [Plantactinospora sp. BC1]
MAGTALSLFGGVAGNAHVGGKPGDAWHVAALNLAAAHQQSRGAGVTVAMVDSRVEPHRDLRGALLPPIDVAPSGTRDGAARGTQLAGLVAARGDGRTSLLGVAPEARILPVRVSGRGFDADPDAVAAGIERAVAGGADVVVSTYSRPGVTDPLAGAVRRAIASNVVVVAPAAPGSPNAQTLADLPGVVAVVGTDQEGRPLRDSVRGLSLDVAAPGDELVAPVHTSLGDAYTEVGGADYAAALVGGVAALVRSKYPQLSGADVARRFIDDAQRDLALGWGVVNAAEALTRTPVELPAARTAAADSGVGRLPRDRQWYLDALAVGDAHRITRGDGGTLGLVAARIDTDRPDLAGRLDRQVGIDAQGDIGDLPGGAARPTDTAAAVLAGGAGGTGYLGVAPAARLIAAGGGPKPGRAQVEAAVRWLVDDGAGVVLVVDGVEELSAAAVAYALARDTVVVAPQAGYPSGVPGVITVRGVQQREPPVSEPAPILAAPGEVNLMLGTDHAASAASDISAAALVAGVVTLVRARNPEADAENVIQRVLSTATAVEVEPSPYGRGLVNPVAALTADVPPVTSNPLGDPGDPADDPGDARRLWLVVGIAVAAGLVLLVVGLTAGMLYRRRRPR